MIPPGLHLITWSIPSTHQNSSGMPIRHAFVRHLSGQETYVLKYSAQEEDMVPNTIDEATGEEIPTILSRDHLRTLDAELAAYPLYRWHGWKALVSWVQDEDVVRLVGRRRKLDSLWESPADDEVVLRGTGSQEGKADSTQEQRPAEQRSEQQEGALSYASFDLKRSWRKGAVGEEVTIFSRDKSWLLQHVIKQHFGGGKLTCVARATRSDSYSRQIVCDC
jgi:A1 cistron-splicing factor AAR2